METTLTSKGQVTIPRHIRQALRMEPGSRLVFEVSEDGRVYFRPEPHPAEVRPDRFDQAVGAAEIPWTGSTDAWMEQIRGEE